MRTMTTALALCAALTLAACGGKSEAPTGEPAAALQGAGWDGGEGLDPTQSSDKVRVIAFFEPG